MTLIRNMMIQAAILWLLALTSLGATAQTVTYFHNDISGTPLLATDAAGNVVWKENYRPYGDRLTNAPASSNNKLWFAGKSFDAATGLSYMGARYYNPTLGRFMSFDPKGIDPEDIQGLNGYTYANNNPYKFVDPDGHSPIDVVFLAYDIGKLGVAVYSGAGVGAAAADVALSAVGVLSPVPGSGEALKAARVIEHGAEAVRAGEKTAQTAEKVASTANNAGRAGKQDRLRELANDDKLGSADRGWIKQEINSIERGQRNTIRNPPGKDLAHERGREAAKGYGYKNSNLQDRDLHRLQHKYDNYGRKNKERPVD